MKTIFQNIVLIFLTMASFSGFPQNEAVIWYFGSHAGLDFSGGVPEPLTDGQISTSEGCSTISDQNGNLLFYTDGVHVWNKNHIYMQNGTQLMGNWSASQSSLVVANPSNNGIFYIFTVDAMENYLTNGFRFSVVDINQNNGLGAVTGKNILLFTPACEKITAVKHNNGSDIWVIAHKWDSDKFYTYLVTSSGVSENPVISSVGLEHTGSYRNAIGYMKASVQGDRIALAIETDSKIDILDFDNQTGLLSNSINFDYPGAGRAYGVEFSPDGTKLYVSSWDINKPMYQLNLQSGTPGGIYSSAILIASGGGIQRAALQLGPDGKIYLARRFENYVGVINNPNEEAPLCNFVEEAVSLSGKQCLLGLPNYLQSYFYPFQTQDFLFNETCFGDTTFFNLTNTTELISVEWNFGDPLSGSANTSTDWNPYHIYSSSGTFTVTLISIFSTNSDTVNKEITINALPDVNLGNDTSFCYNDSFILDPGQGYDQYLWQDGSTNSTFTADTSGLYWVQVTNEFGCSATDSISLEIFPTPDIDIGNDTLICIGTTLEINAGSGFESYLWNTGSSDSTITIDTIGIYWVEVTNEYGCSTMDSITIGLYPDASAINLGGDTTFCYGQQFILNAGSGYTLYEWQDGSTDSIFIADTAGVYFVHVVNPCGEGWDTINLSLYPITEIDIGNDTSVCLSDGFVLLDPGMGFQSYLWQDGSVNQFYYANQTGDYWVEVIDEYGCPVSDTISLFFIDPDPGLWPDTTICNGDEITFTADDGFVTYLWNDGTNGVGFTTGSEGIYWCEVTDSMGCTGADSVILDLLYPPEISLGNDTAICTGDSLSLTFVPYDSSFVFLWFDGSDDSVKLISDEGYYWVQASNICGSDIDSVFISFLPLPQVFIGNDTIIGIKDKITLDAGSGFESYLWNTGSEFQYITVSDSGSYWVRVSDGTCFNSDTINVEKVKCDLFIPIVFTPNWDNYNDYFYAVASDDITDFDLTVYNRWGEQMWETTHVNGKWDGKKNGKNCDTGTYFWVTKYKCLLSNKTFTLKGSVTLLR